MNISQWVGLIGLICTLLCFASFGLAALVRRVTLRERERCAQVCELVVYENTTDDYGRSEVKLAAGLIRLGPKEMVETPDEIAARSRAVRAEFAELHAARRVVESARTKLSHFPIVGHEALFDAFVAYDAVVISMEV